MGSYDANFTVTVVDSGTNWTVTGSMGGVTLRSGTVAKATYPTEEAARAFAVTFLANALKSALGW